MEQNYITIIKGSQIARVKVSDIMMVERYQRKLHVITDDKQYVYYESLDAVAPLLDENFYPCLKGCYINLSKVNAMSNRMITFDNGSCFTLGRENFLKTKHTYMEYLKKNQEEV